MHRSLRILLAITTVLLAAAVAPAQTSFGGGSNQGGGTVNGKDPDSGLVYAGVTVRAGDWSGPPSICTYLPWSAALLTAGVSHPGISDTRGGVTYALYLKTCPGDPWVTGFEGKLAGTRVWVPIIPPTTALPRLAQQYVERLAPKPTFASAPPDNTTYVKVRSWFWTTTAFTAVAATASVPSGRGWLRATTTATPVGLTYTPGDGELGTGPVTCLGPGERWREGYDDTHSNTCVYEFLHSSAVAADGERFHGTVAINWHVTFRNSNGQSGDLGDFTTTTPVNMTVKEIHAIVVA